MALAITGAKTIGATRETVWSALNDVDCLRLCVAGCQDLQRDTDRSFRLSVLVRLGPIAVPFHGTIEVTESDYPRSYAMTGRGHGGVAGFANGTARILLTEARGGCRLAYSFRTAQTGPLENLGAWFLTGVARTLSDRFVTSLAALVEAQSRDGLTAPQPDARDRVGQDA